MDVSIGLLMALATVPVVVICAAVSAAMFRAWPFFTQEREGLDGRRFHLVKIRSLPTSVPADLDRNQLDVYPTSRWGRFLRERHLDELPQFWQVVTGTMSLVGPRPMIVSICERMDDDARERRNQGVPGVTGLWQISEDGTRHVIDAMHHDERYLAWSSLRLDVAIIAITVQQILGRPRLTEGEIIRRFPSIADTLPSE